MAGVSRKPWKLFLDLVAMGCSVNQACDLLGIHRNTVFQRAQRNAQFRQSLENAFVRRATCHAIDPEHWVHPLQLEPILGPDFERIPRVPPLGLKSWVHDQLRANLLRQLAA